MNKNEGNDEKTTKKQRFLTKDGRFFRRYPEHGKVH